MTHDLSPVQALAPEARAAGSAWLRPLRDDGSNPYGARPRVRQVLASTRTGDFTTSVVPETRRHGASWSARATANGMTVIGIGDSLAESLNNFWTKWEAA
jgi:hypothetical protein